MISSLLLGVYVVCGAVGCVLVPLIVSRVSHHGVSGLVDGGHNLLPAVAFVVLVGGGVVLGVRSLWRQISASRVLGRRVQSLALELPGELAQAAIAAGLKGRVVLVDSPEWFSFAYGAMTPQVAVSRRLLEGVSTEELRAVLEHERYHVRNLDPLKVLICSYYYCTVVDRDQRRHRHDDLTDLDIGLSAGHVRNGRDRLGVGPAAWKAG